MNLLEQPISRRALVAGAAGLAANVLLRRELAAGPAAGDNRAVWDAHTHLSAVTGNAAERIDKLLAIADRMGIQRLVVFMGLKWSQDPSPADMRQQNDEVIQAVTHSPQRVLGFVYLNPKHVEASLAEMDRCIRHGPLVGVKLWVAMRCNQAELDPIVRRAVELKVPLLQHTYIRSGPNLPGESNATDVADLAARHPDARFICAHVGNDWEQGIRAIRASKNVWAETSGSDPTAGMVEMAVRELGAARVIYGSDAGGRSYASQLAKVESADLPDADRQMILRGNLRRLLADVLAAKGITS